MAAAIDGWARVFARYCDLNLAFSKYRTLDHAVVQLEKLTCTSLISAWLVSQTVAIVL